MRILIIEDEQKTANYLKKGLTENGFIVDVAMDGHEGVLFAVHEVYDLIILDVMLPTLDGWTILKTLRQRGLKTPVLFLTARDAVADRVKGLELGAEDYLVKPFAFSELLARVRNILRRGHREITENITIDDLSIDLMTHKVFRADQRLELTPQEFALLLLLARRQSHVVSRTVIAEKIWNMNFDSQTNIVDVAIGRLRRKVDDGSSNKLIHTIRGAGYVLENRKKKSR